MKTETPTGIGKITDQIEETSIAICLALMVLITFSNVITRYIFEGNLLWALETTVFLFAWLCLMGTSYCIKKQAHIGVDVVINLVPPGVKRLLAIISAVACLTFAILLLIGSWNYWYPFISNLAYLTTEDIFMPFGGEFLGNIFNEGESYEKVPRFIPYLALPLGLALITLRFIQLAWKVLKGERDSLIASHEAEELLEKAAIEKTEEKK